MKHLLLYFTILFLSLSCNQEEEIPNYVISENEMIAVLVDMEIVQAEVKYNMAYSSTTIDNYKQEFERTLHNHNLTTESFNKNIEYYCSKPLIMQDIYIRVLELLSEKQSSQVK